MILKLVSDCYFIHMKINNKIFFSEIFFCEVYTYSLWCTACGGQPVEPVLFVGVFELGLAARWVDFSPGRQLGVVIR